MREEQLMGTAWVATADNARYHVWCGDEFVVNSTREVVTIVRNVPLNYFREMIKDSPDRVKQVGVPARRLAVVR